MRTIKEYISCTILSLIISGTPVYAEGTIHYECTRVGVHVTYHDYAGSEVKNMADTWNAGSMHSPLIKYCRIKNGHNFKTTLNYIVYNDTDGYAQCNASYYATMKVEDEKGKIYFDSKLDLADWCFNDKNDPVIEDVEVFNTGHVTYDKVTHNEQNIETETVNNASKITGADIAGPLEYRTKLGK